MTRLTIRLDVLSSAGRRQSGVSRGSVFALPEQRRKIAIGDWRV